MSDTLFLGLSAMASLVGWYVVVRTYVWPRLLLLPKAKTLQALLPIHFVRFIGTGFLITGVVAQALPRGFAVPATYGDLISMVLAYIAFAALQWSASPALRVGLTWLFNIVGTVDLVFAFAAGPVLIKHIGDFGATYFVLIVPVPLLMISHLFIFRTLLRRSPLKV